MKKFSAKKLLPLLGFFLLIPSLLLNIYFYLKTSSPSNPSHPPTGILVLEVLDGDTILLEGKVRLRLRDIDAPELEFCGGQEAKDLLTTLAKGKRIDYQEKILDQKGRPMALVYVRDTLVNLEMLKSGWVRYHSDQSSYRDVLKEAGDKVRNEEKGIFSQKCSQKENLENPKCNIKGNHDKNSGAKKYYYPGCAQYEFTIVEKDIGENWFCTEKEAQNAGYTKAATCP